MSRTSDVATTMMRLLRKLPSGQRRAGEMALRLRTSRTARKAVSRMFDFDDSGIGGTVFLGAGNVIEGVGLDNLPVIIVNFIGAPAEDVPGLVEVVAQEQLLTGGFRPVIVFDGDHFATVRQYGYPMEHVIPRADWGGDDHSWEAFVRRRLQRVRRDYSASGYVDLAKARDAGLLFLSTLELRT